MTVQQFQQLSEDEQACAVHQRGHLVSLRYGPRLRVLLYQIQAFYVEVFYNPRRNVIESFNCFDDTDLLEPYLEKIPLEWVAAC